MKAIVLAGDSVHHPADVEIWIVHDADYELMMEEEKSWRRVLPEKILSVEDIAEEILSD